MNGEDFNLVGGGLRLRGGERRRQPPRDLSDLHDLEVSLCRKFPTQASSQISRIKKVKLE